MRIWIGCAHLDRSLSYPDLHYLSGCCLPIRIGALSGRLCPIDVRAGACGEAPRSITSFPPISHVIPRRLFQLLKYCRCNCNVFLGCSKVTGLNYVRDLWGSMCEICGEVCAMRYVNGGGAAGGARPRGARLVLSCVYKTAGPMQSHRPRVPHKEGSDAQWRGVPWARASRISVRSLTSSETSGAGASSSAFLRRALRAFMGTTMQK